jgi:hypothetical protein
MSAPVSLLRFARGSGGIIRVHWTEAGAPAWNVTLEKGTGAEQVVLSVWYYHKDAVASAMKGAEELGAELRIAPDPKNKRGRR